MVILFLIRAHRESELRIIALVNTAAVSQRANVRKTNKKKKGIDKPGNIPFFLAGANKLV